MARESYTSFTLRGPIPHTGVVSDIHRQPYTMKLKNKFILVHPKIGLGVTCPFFSFGLLSISGPPGKHSLQQIPTYRPQNHLSWGKPKLNSFLSFPLPHTRGILH